MLWSKAIGAGGAGGLVEGWNVSTADFVQSFPVAAQGTDPAGVFFKQDGLKMYIVEYSQDYVNEYDLSIAWDVSTAVFFQRFFVGARESTPTGIFFKPDGLKMYVENFSLAQVNEYDLNTAWDISTSVYIRGKAVGAQEAQPLGLFFKPDGTKMYVVGVSGDDVNEYDLTE